MPRSVVQGIWIWSSPLEMRNSDGSTYSMLLIDTEDSASPNANPYANLNSNPTTITSPPIEGIDAYDQTGQYSTQIFSLAVRPSPWRIAILARAYTSELLRKPLTLC